jgi:hypothetical protein
MHVPLADGWLRVAICPQPFLYYLSPPLAGWEEDAEVSFCLRGQFEATMAEQNPGLILSKSTLFSVAARWLGVQQQLFPRYPARE